MVSWVPIDEVKIFDVFEVDPAIATEIQGRQISDNADCLLK